MVLRHRPDAIDVSTTAVVGPHGVVVVDALGSPTQARRARGLLAEVTSAPVVGLVLTHAHWDHAFGASAYADVPSWAHHRYIVHLAEHEAAELATGHAGDHAPDDDAPWDDVDLAPPDVPVPRTTTIRPGGRDLVLRPLDVAHTTCDLVVHVPDAGVWVVGDVVEESGEPSLEIDSDPARWARQLTALAGRMAARDVVVPGHGAVVDRAFVRAQAVGLAAAARARPPVT
nr:MBL fold metallo-hydrolase [Cellulomonas sp. APG4]